MLFQQWNAAGSHFCRNQVWLNENIKLCRIQALDQLGFVGDKSVEMYYGMHEIILGAEAKNHLEQQLSGSQLKATVGMDIWLVTLQQNSLRWR